MPKKAFLARLGNRLSRALGRRKPSSRHDAALPHDGFPPSQPDDRIHVITNFIQRDHHHHTQDDTRPVHRQQARTPDYIHHNPSISSTRPLTMAAASPSVRQSRRASFRQRFWSISSANYFGELDEDLLGRRPSVTSPSPDPNRRSAYVPRHAASDFHKTSNNNRRQTINTHLAASERIAARFGEPEPNDDIDNDDDDATLCSVNLREDDPEENIRDLDMWLATLHRQQALQALSTPAEQPSSQPSQRVGPSLSPLHVSPHNRHSQTYHSWYPPVVDPSTQDSDDEYGLYARDEHDEALRRRRRTTRYSAVFWSEIDRAALPRRASQQQDAVLHRNSTYRVEVQQQAGPVSPAVSSRPVSFFGGGTSLSEWTQPQQQQQQQQRPMSVARTVSEKRRASCARLPGVMTVAEG